MVRFIGSFILLLFLCAGFAQTNSVLNVGEWFKIGITETGLYKIDKNYLDIIGVNSGSIDPQKLAIFGNGVKGALPQRNNIPRPFDLIQNSIMVVGEQDGSFDSEDYLLFYGVGPDKKVWKNQGLEYEKNPYSDTAYYFLTVLPEKGLRVSTKPIVDEASQRTITTYHEAIVEEEDLFTVIFSGRKWLGNQLSNGEKQSFNYSIEGIIDDPKLTVSVVNRSSDVGYFTFTGNGSNLGEIELPRILTPSNTPSTQITAYDIKAWQRQVEYTFNPLGQNVAIDVAFRSSGTQTAGHIDYMILSFERELSLRNNETYFRNLDAYSGVSEYRLAGSSDMTIWEVTSATNPTTINYQTLGNSNYSFKSIADSTIQEFVAFNQSNFQQPFMFGKVSNQNLKSETSFDGLIITIPQFYNEALRLADFHKTHDHLNVKVSLLQEIYNEFSSGRRDITAIRDYVKYLYDSNNGQLKYLLLFGDTSYDFKNRVRNNNNRIPTYQSRESFDPVRTYASDDYYGFLEEGEGEWKETNEDRQNHTLEIGIGRLTVNSAKEAKIVVDKIINYATNPQGLGKWRNHLTYVADDGDRNDHTQDAEILSKIVDSSRPQFQIEKIFLDTYEQGSETSSGSAPEMTLDLENQILEGTFIVNFMGHGNEGQWMHEDIFSRDDIPRLNNRNKLPIFVTATCDFGRYDNPILSSGAEELLLSEDGGAIALLTTCRPVYSFSNLLLNRAFHQFMFLENNRERLGDIVRKTKNNAWRDVNNRNFTLLGDPMLRPAYPKLDLVINNQSSIDTLSAMEKVTMTGKVVDNNQDFTGFNGILDVAIKDQPQEFLTLGHESAPYPYTIRNNIIFNGQASVKNGSFEFSFVVPKNISYQNANANLSMYASDAENNLDAAGESNRLIVAGTTTSTIQDNTPPEIQSYINDASFKSGDIVGSSSLFIAQIQDESGITTASSGVVDGISLTIGEETYNLNEYYTASLDDFTNGTVVFPIKNLNPGRYQAVLRVWDTHNNLNQSKLTFNVTDQPIIQLFDEVAYPNPASDHITFKFRHDKTGQDLMLYLDVFDNMGKKIYRLEKRMDNSPSSVDLNWNLLNYTGQEIPNGNYFFKLLVNSRRDGAVTEWADRLIKSN